MEWISVDDELPKVPDDKFGIKVLCSVHDPTYEELNPGNGSDTQTAIWNGKIFEQVCYGIIKGNSFCEIDDIVTHWMYYPKAVQIKKEGLK